MTRRSAERAMTGRGRVWRTAAVAAAFLATGGPVALAQGADVATGEPPAVVSGEPTVETGVIDDTVVAVGMPPVPPATVEVGLPPVPAVPTPGEVSRPPLPNLPDTGDGSGGASDISASIAGAIAGIAGDAWRA